MASQAQKNLATLIEYAEDPQVWRDAPANFKDGKLKILDHPVMEDWERPYMEELARIATMNGGVVLEVGFGLAISANYVQSHPIEKHIIIEANAEVFSKLKEFAQTAEKPVEAHLGLWQDFVPTIPDASIDGILFDPYALSVEDLDCHYPFFQHAYRILKPGGIFTYYSDEATDFSPEHLERLQSAGFEMIESQLCAVDPPEDCLYWSYEDKTLLVPIIRK